MGLLSKLKGVGKTIDWMGGVMTESVRGGKYPQKWGTRTYLGGCARSRRRL